MAGSFDCVRSTTRPGSGRPGSHRARDRRRPQWEIGGGARAPVSRPCRRRQSAGVAAAPGKPRAADAGPWSACLLLGSTELCIPCTSLGGRSRP
jgi:hypothetical protein